MSNAEHIIEHLILELSKGRDMEDIFQDIDIKQNFETGEICMTPNEAKRIVSHVIELYDGKYPINHLEVGDVCIDAFGVSPCIITSVGYSIHVLYLNGKTKKFPNYEERKFKKLDINVKELLDILLVSVKDYLRNEYNWDLSYGKNEERDDNDEDI